MYSQSFDPIVDLSCTKLILGTMPGIKSLEKKQYYAHERNLFWPLLFDVFQTRYVSDYQLCKEFILLNKIALWDTLNYCFREGSLDSDIKNAAPNDIPNLLKSFPQIKNIVFNGKYAEKFYKKHHPFIPEIRYLTMPSTSPANARLNYDEKLKHWMVLKEL
jgi:hypoxanthine-DNA glycosylase